MAKTQTKAVSDRKNVEEYKFTARGVSNNTKSNFKEATMRSSKTEMPVTNEGEGYVFRETTWGAMHVEIDTFNKDLDVTPFLKGLPDDMDPTEHWGYVFKGRFRVIYKDREEVFNAGDVFYAEPGHTAIFEAGTEFVMFSPEEQVQKTGAVVETNLAALQQKQ